MKYSKEQREMIIKHSIGKTIADLYYEETEEYWVMTFTDGSETSFRFMSEIVGSDIPSCSETADKVETGSD